MSRPLLISAVLLASGHVHAEERTNWPCRGCTFVTPAGYQAGTPTPLLVTFHGDEGDPDYIQWKLEDRTSESGFLMLNLNCPRDLGCGLHRGSWWRWEAYSRSHDREWVGQQIDAVEAEYVVDPQQIFLAGFSGGSSYLSEYPWPYTMRYAGLIYLGGGYEPYGENCNVDCKIPAYFLIGSEDFLLDGAQNLSAYLSDCGHDVTYVEVPGVDHQIVSSGLGDLFGWMMSTRHLCQQAPTPSPPDAGFLPDAAAPPPAPPPPAPALDATVRDAIALDAAAARAPDATPRTAAQAALRSPLQGGCSCQSGTDRPRRGSAESLWAVLLLVWVTRRRGATST